VCKLSSGAAFLLYYGSRGTQSYLGLFLPPVVITPALMLVSVLDFSFALSLLA